MTSSFGHQVAWSGDFPDHRDRWNRFNRIHGAISYYMTYLVTHDDGGNTGNLDLTTWDSLDAAAPVRSDVNVNGLTEKLAAPWSLSTTPSSNGIFVVYSASDTRVKLANVALDGSVISEQTVLDLPPGFTVGLVDVDASRTLWQTDSAAATAVAVLAHQSPNLCKIFLMLCDESGNWSSEPITLDADCMSYNPALPAPVQAPNVFAGPLAVQVNPQSFAGVMGPKTCHARVLARGADYGKVVLWDVPFDKSDSDNVGDAVKVSDNLSPSSTNTRETTGGLYSATPNEPYLTDPHAPCVLVAVGTPQMLALGEYGPSGWMTEGGMAFSSVTLPGTHPTLGEVTPRVGTQDLTYMAVAGGVQRVCFQVVRQVRWGNGNSHWTPIMFVHGKVEDDEDGSSVAWHTNSGYSPHESTSARITNIFSASNGRSLARLTFAYFRKRPWGSGAELLNMGFGWNKVPSGGGSVASPGESEVISTDTPVLKSPPVVTTKTGLDVYTTFWLREPGENWSRTAESPFTGASFLSTHEAQLPASQGLFQGDWEAIYLERDAHGLGVPIGPGYSGDYTSFTVSHPPSSQAHSPSGGAIVEATLEPSPTPVTLRWALLDGSPVDHQTAFEIELERVGGPNFVSTGKLTGATPEYEVSGILSASATKYRWRVRLWDRDDVQGSWSSWQEFYLARLPAPSIVAPADPITTPRPTFEWVHVQGTFGPQTGWRVLVTDLQGKVTHDTGWRSGNHISYTPENPILELGKTYRVLIYTRDAQGAVGAALLVAPTQWARPPVGEEVTISTAEYASKGIVQIEWDTNWRDVDFVEWRVYRRIVGTEEWDFVGSLDNTAVSDGLVDLLAPANTPIEYVVAQLIDHDGVAVESERVLTHEVTAVDDHYWIMDPELQGVEVLDFNNSNPLSLKLAHVTGDPFSEEVEEETLNIIGRGRVRVVGTRWGYSGTLSASLRGLGGLPPRAERMELEATRLAGKTVLLRNPFGDIFKVALGAITFSRVEGVGTSEFLEVEIPYQEVS